MKVHIKKDSYQSSIPLYFAMVFLLVVASVFTMTAINQKDSDKIIMIAMACIFVYCFLGFLIFALIKPPKRYNALLKEKKMGSVKGTSVTEMLFEIERPEGKVANIPTSYKCYTEEYNQFQEGQYYALYLKEFNWRPKRVEALNGAKAKERMGTVSFIPVVIAFLFVITGILISSIVGIVKCMSEQKPWFPYLASIPFCIALLYGIYKVKLLWDKDNAIKPVVYTGRGFEKGVESLPVNMTSPSFFSIEVQRMLEVSFVDRRIYDGNRNLVLTMKGGPLSLNRRSVVDCNGIEIAQISGELINTSNTFTVEIAGEAPFTVRRKIMMTVEYEVEGLDYIIYGSKVNGSAYMSMNHTICNLKGETVATISRHDTGSAWSKVGEMDVRVLPEFENNIYIMLMALCVSEEYERCADNR